MQDAPTETPAEIRPRPPRLTLDEIAAKYNLPPDEVQRRRILSKMKKRLIGYSEEAERLNVERALISHVGVTSMKSGFREIIIKHAFSGNMREKQRIRFRSRCSHLAYGFFKNRPYLVVENSCKTPPDWGRVKDLILEQGGESRVVLQKWAEWMSKVPPSARHGGRGVEL